MITQHVRGKENWWSYLYLIPDISLREGYLLVNKLIGFEESYRQSLKENARSGFAETYPSKFEENEIVLGDMFGETAIQIKNTYILITMDGGN